MWALPTAMENMPKGRAVARDGDSVVTVTKTTIQHKGKEREVNPGTEGYSHVQTLFPTPSKGHYYYLPAERGALETLMNHGLCRVSKLIEEQVENVWKKVPLKEGGGQDLAISWMRISRFIRSHRDRVRNKDESMQRWDKWVDDHRQQARNSATPPRDTRFKRRRCYEDLGEGEDTANSVTSVAPRAKRSKPSPIDSRVPDANLTGNSPSSNDAPIPHPPQSILDPHLQGLYQPYLGLTPVQINCLAHLVRLGGCYSTTRDLHLIQKIWLRVPQSFGGGLGIGVPPNLIKSFVHSRGTVFRTEEGFTRWENWIASNRPNVVVEQSLSHGLNGDTVVDAEGATTMIDGNVGDNEVGESMASVAVAELPTGVGTQARQPEGSHGRTENPEGELVFRATPQVLSIDASTQSYVSQLSGISPAVEKAPHAHDVFTITQNIVSYLNRLTPAATKTPQPVSLNSITQTALRHGDSVSSPSGNFTSTPAAYQPRKSYSSKKYHPRTDTAPTSSPALQTLPGVALAPPIAQPSCVSEAVADVAARPLAEYGAVPRNPWLREDGSVRDWYWYPPGGPGGPGGRLFEHWSSSAVPLQQFDPLHTHEVTLTIGRDPGDIASVLRGLEQWAEVKQVRFHGYQPQPPSTGTN